MVYVSPDAAPKFYTHFFGYVSQGYIKEYEKLKELSVAQEMETDGKQNLELV